MFKKKIDIFIGKIKKLQGEPHDLALGMAIGVFVAVTPTMPFHTVGAIVLAYLFKASKPAAVLGVWVSNPFTVVFLYMACYKVGLFFFGDTMEGTDAITILIQSIHGDLKTLDKLGVFTDFVRTRIRTFAVMNAGGLILGIPSGIITYYFTKIIFQKTVTTF